MAILDVKQLLQDLTVEEKIKLLSGKDFWHTADIPDKKIPSLRFSDGPNGLRGTKFFNSVPSACLPCGTAMGATFDQGLLEKAGQLVGDEAHAKGVHVVLGPTVNIQRSPLGGRGFESFSEDPVLSGLSSSAMVNGIQSKGIQATVKHFVGNDQEHERRSVNELIPSRALREIYLMPFQLTLRDAKPGCMMSSYNKVNGTHVSESKDIIKDLLRDEWGFEGLLMSDWFGVYSTSEAVAAGLNLEMPGGQNIFRGGQLENLFLSRKVSIRDIDFNTEKVLNLVNRALEESGIPENAPEGENNTKESAQVLRQLAGESVVVLKNEGGILPLKKSASTAVIGPNAHFAAYCGGGSASLNAYYTVTPLEGVKSKVGESNVRHTLGLDTSVSLPLIGNQLKTADGKKGFTFKCYDGPVDDPNRKLVDTLHMTDSNMFMPDYTPDLGEKDTFYIDIEGYFTPERDGTYEFGCIVNGTGNVYIDDKLLIDNTSTQRQGTAFMGTGTVEETGRVDMVAGKSYKYSVVYGGAKTSKLLQGSTIVFGGGMRLGVRQVVDAEKQLAEAVEVAKSVDQVVLCIGLTQEFESEGFDRDHMDLPEGTTRLIETVLKANPNTVVVNQSGTPVTLPWVDQVKGLVHAWFGGNETGNGIADVLFGDVNPSGKLSLSWPKRVEDNPAYFNFKSENGVTVYGENVYVGYRYYDTIKREALFPFGHGLSYTTFEYGDINASVEGDDLVTFVKVTNTGKVAGKESVQFYVSQRSPSIQRPPKELKSYVKLELAPGESKTATTKIPLKYATSYWDDSRDQWIQEKGVYDVHAAASSSDIRSTTDFSVEKTTWWSGV